MKRIFLMLGALAASGAVAGCGAADDINPDVVAQAADKTAEAGGAKVAFTAETQGIKMSGDGFVDTKARTGRLFFDVPQFHGRMEEVFVGRTFYFQFPDAVRKKLPGAKPWLKLDIARALRKEGVDLSSLQSPATTSDPSQTLDQLRGAGDVTKVGTEKIRGTDTTHYKTTIDLNRAVERAPAARRDAARRSIQALIKLTGVHSFPMEVWLDKAGRMRRMNFNETIKGQTLNMSMDMYDFGTKDAVKAPPASETGDFTELVKKAQAGG